MASLAAAQRAKEALKARVGHPSWLKGIGIGGTKGDYCVKVNVASLTDEVHASLPATIDDVPVIVEAVGQIRSQRR